jgi:Flp pilus assembly protein TadG
MLRDLLKCTRGASTVETALTLVLMLGLTFGIVEFANALWQWNTAEKATKVGARLAATADPVAQQLKTFDCATSTIVLGTNCKDPSAATFGTITCSGATTSCSGGYTYSSTAMAAVVSGMQAVFPRIQTANVVVEYRDVRLGFAGRGRAVPVITVRLTGMTYTFTALDNLYGLGPITMPDFRATLTGEDLSDDGA